MSNKFVLVSLLLVVASLFLVTAGAQAIPITFQVRMSHQIALGNFSPESDFVDLAGSFNGWGNNPLTVMSDADGDTIYDITLTGFDLGEAIEFKFRINGQWDGSEEFTNGGPNRAYVVLESENLIDVWYNDQDPVNEVGELYWWNDSVFYEIFVRSFYDSDGDGVGDFQGLIQKLDYLNDGDPNTDDDLGITGIWLMPINDSPSYHGYDSTDYRSINPDYGTTADFQEFLEAAHDRGIKVIIDYVMNHCSNQHPWFVASAQGNPVYEDYFRWSPSDPGQTGPWGQNLWHWNSFGYYYGLFGGGMPDLNYQTQAVKDEMFNTATYWLDTIGVDGFRLDAVLYVMEEGDQYENTASTLQFWQDFNTHIKGVKPEVVTVGEAWTSSSIVKTYSSNDRLDFCFEFDLSFEILDAVNASDTYSLSYKANQVYGLYPYLQFGTFLTNHDLNRSFDVFGYDEGKARLAAGIYLSLPGIPFVYYGEEIGMTGSGAHENIRSPLHWSDEANAGFTTGDPWQPLSFNYWQHNILDEQQDPQSLLSYYRKFIKLRNETPALRRGTYYPLADLLNTTLSFVRQYEQQTVICVANTLPLSMTGITLTGYAGSLVPGEHTLVNLLDAEDTFTVTVSQEYEISGFDLDGFEVAVYEFVTATGVIPDVGNLPDNGILLEDNYPNPFNPSTKLSFEIPASGHANLAVYDVGGNLVNTLLDGNCDRGRHELFWDGRDAQGKLASAGVYLYRLEVDGVVEAKRMLLVK